MVDEPDAAVGHELVQGRSRGQLEVAAERALEVDPQVDRHRCRRVADHHAPVRRGDPGGYRCRVVNRGATGQHSDGHGKDDHDDTCDHAEPDELLAPAADGASASRNCRALARIAALSRLIEPVPPW